MAKPKRQLKKGKESDLKQDITLVDERVSMLKDLLVEKGILKEGEYESRMRERIKDLVELDSYEDLTK